MMEHRSSVKNSEKKALTLLEILVVMSVFAMLIALSFSLLSVIRRNSRDNERISTGSDLVEFINDFRRLNNFTYPETDEVTFNETQIQIRSDVILPDGTENNIIRTYDLENFLTFSISTDSSSTNYYYENINGAFAFCLELENSSTVRSFGTEECPENTDSWHATP
ncbi:MAG: type II secretion system protein [Candidatus Dojkabacteria bacterium]|nr:type II secretion system protein [Candidatus Dojkabacteria bacterium]MDQ7020460.1 type II secretion system protein [Candidatus Dojkabacteria bacterium]